MSETDYLPAPEPPTKGVWIDPEDQTQIRYHNGKRWSRISYPRYEGEPRPKGQGLFLLGTGKEGIPTGAPLAEAKGRYLGKFGIWAGILAICGGFAAMWIGVNHDLPALGYPGLAVIVAMFSFFGITAWRGGFRPPLWGNKRACAGFYGWLALVSGGGLAFWIAPVLPRDSIAYDWTNRIGMILLNGVTCSLGIFTLWVAFLSPERGLGPKGEERYVRAVLILILLALPALVMFGTWDLLMDALWIS